MIAKQEVDRAIETACNGNVCRMLGPGNSTLYTSKIYGLPFIPTFTTTKVRLDMKRLSPALLSSSSSTQDPGDSDDDDENGGDDMNQGNNDGYGNNGDESMEDQGKSDNKSHNGQEG